MKSLLGSTLVAVYPLNVTRYDRVVFERCIRIKFNWTKFIKKRGNCIKSVTKVCVDMDFVLKKGLITVIVSLIIQITPIITINSNTKLTQNETASLLQKCNLPTASSATSLNDWFDTLNDQYRLLSRIIAAIAWELRYLYHLNQTY